MRESVDPAGRDRGRVVVTGLGAVSGFGWGLGPLWEGLRAARVAIGPFDRFDHRAHRTHLASQVPPMSEGACDPPSIWKRSSYADRFAVFAAREAVRGAALDLDSFRSRLGVFFGTSTGGMLEGEEYFQEILRGARRRQRVSLLASQPLDGPGDAVARSLRIEGPVGTISSACSSGAMALGAALSAVRRGEVDAALAGGADSLCRLTYSGFNALRSVDPDPCRPFRRDRAGLSIGEGAAAVLLEPLEGALAREATPIVELAGFAATCDAHHMTAPEVDGSGAARAILESLKDARVEADDVDFVNAHGTGTLLNDRAEWRALSRVFGGRIATIPITSTKALLGHLLGSAGVLEAVATALCLRAREVHPMPRSGVADPALPANLVLYRPRPLERARHGLSTSLAFGGANAAIVLSRYG